MCIYVPSHRWLKYRQLWRNTTKTRNHIHARAHNFKWNKMLLLNTMSTTATKFEKGMHRRRLRLYVLHAYSTNEAFSNIINVSRGSRHSLREEGGGVHYLRRKFDRQKKKDNSINNNKIPDRSRGGCCFSTLYTWSMSSEFLWGREGKGGDMIFV